MRVMGLVTALTVLLMGTVAWGDCRIPEGDKLTIGCTLYNCKSSYISAIEEVAFDLNLPVEIVTVRNGLTQFDGVLSPGGHDILPKYYTDNFIDYGDAQAAVERFYRLGKTGSLGQRRDAFEVDFFSNYFDLSPSEQAPSLGICYGMQMLSVVQGEALYVDIFEQLKIPNRYSLYDTIELEENISRIPDHFQGFHTGLIDLKNRLKDQQRDLIGYESHHQGIDMKNYLERGVNSNLVVAGTSNGGQIGEIIYSKSSPSLGVQFHPEVSKRSPELKQYIFKWFLKKACEFHNRI